MSAGRESGRPHEGVPRRLLLLRHAKSDREVEEPDHERPLAPRGRRASERMGEELARRGATPELVLCSTARRTRETLALVRPHLGNRARVELDRRLYLATPAALLERIAEVDDGVRCLMLVGHNPGLAELAVALAGTGDREARARLARKFPTGAFAELRFRAARWRELARGEGELVAFVAPRALEEPAG